MKIINGLDNAELAKLAPGDEVGLSATRDANFRAYSPDQVLVISQMPAYLTLSVQRNEPQNVITSGKVASVGAPGPNIELSQVSATAAIIEDAQVRISSQNAVDLALVLLAALGPTQADNLRSRIAMNPHIAALFSPNA